MWRFGLPILTAIGILGLIPRTFASDVADSLDAPETGSWLLDTRPRLNMSISKNKDVTDWNTKINLSRQLSEKIHLKLGATLHTRENSTLNRSDSNDGTNAVLRYKLNDDISFSVNFNSTVSAYRYDLKRKGPRDTRKNEDLTVSSDLSKQLSDAINVSLGVVAGSTSNSFASVRNNGSRRNIKGSISFSPSEDFGASANYTSRRLFLKSSIDSVGASVFRSKDRTFTQDLSFSLSYKIVPGIRIGADAARGDERKQHPDRDQKKQETERRVSRRASVTSSFNLLERLTWDVSVGFNQSEKSFTVRSERNSKIGKASLSAKARVQAWRGAVLNIGGSRDVSRSEYVTSEAGDDIHKTLSLKLSQDLGPRAGLSLTALSDMVSVFYDDKQANPKDRDMLSNRVNVNVNYKPLGVISTRLGGQYSVEKSVYVRSESSANNRTTRKYVVSGGYDFETIYRIEVQQDYDIGAVYTFYHYGDSRNTLVRNSNVKTRFRIPVARRVHLRLNHNYKFQDQGSYREEDNQRLYGKSGERESHLLTIGLNYNVIKSLGILINQTYFVQRNWKYVEGKKELDFETKSTEITGRLRFEYKFGDRSRVALSVEQRRKEGDRVGEAFRKYRNIEFEASHVF